MNKLPELSLLKPLNPPRAYRLPRKATKETPDRGLFIELM